MGNAEQYEMALPRRQPVDTLREQLADVVSEFNVAWDPRERCRLFREIESLRRRIAAGGAR